MNPDLLASRGCGSHRVRYTAGSPGQCVADLRDSLHRVGSGGLTLEVASRKSIWIWMGGGHSGGYFNPGFYPRTGISMLPVAVASVLLFVSGVWWTASVLLARYWDRHFETPGRHAERLQEREKPRDRVSSFVGTVMIYVPSVVTIGLALDGFLDARVIFYARGWSWSLPEASALQLFGAILVFVALPLFTSTVYLIEKHADSKLPKERVLVQGGPYAYVRHPMHLAAFLLGIGWVLLAQNFAALVLLFLLEGVFIARKEEPKLVETYGDAYRVYQRRTGFFLPRWRRFA